MAEISENSLQFDLPKNRSSVIKVIGVGGGGSNAVNHMKNMGIKGVDFIVCNTDAQALEHSPVENKIQLGANLTEGLGAGANPDVGRQAGEESREAIQEILRNNTRMVFITAGMGGGTGTGAAPVIARCAKEMGILTVGIVTKPFAFEGKIRAKQAQDGIDELRQYVDSLVVINNDKLREVYGNLSFRSGFAKADEVLATAAKGIAEVITYHYTTNIDLRDVRTVLENSGTAIMGSAKSGGDDRAINAVAQAIDSPLLNDNHIHGAKNVLLLIVSGSGDQEITMDEMSYINEHIQEQAGGNANVIMGIGIDDNLTDEISVTIIATGFPANQHHTITGQEPEKIIHPLEEDQTITKDIFQKPFQEVKQEKPKAKVSAQPDLFSLLDEKAQPADLSASLPLNTPEESVLSAENEFEPIESSTPFTAHTEHDNDDFIFIQLDENTDEHVDMIIKDEGAALMEWDTGKEEMSFITDEISEDNLFIIEEEIELEQAIESEPAINPFEDKITEILPKAIDQPLAPAATMPSPDEPLKPVAEPSGKIVHTLDDLRELENRLQIRRPSRIESTSTESEAPAENKTEIHAPVAAASTSEENHDESLKFEVKNIHEPLNSVEEEAEEDILNRPISAASRLKIMERKNRLQAFNYQFREHKQDAMSQEPAFRRAGLELGTDQYSSVKHVSRMGLSGQGADIEIKTNNSFLHDNVD
jgi:cell division protein FtsZ